MVCRKLKKLYVSYSLFYLSIPVLYYELVLNLESWAERVLITHFSGTLERKKIVYKYKFLNNRNYRKCVPKPSHSLAVKIVLPKSVLSGH